jgi:hypothetical protein
MSSSKGESWASVYLKCRNSEDNTLVGDTFPIARRPNKSMGRCASAELPLLQNDVLTLNTDVVRCLVWQSLEVHAWLIPSRHS